MNFSIDKQNYIIISLILCIGGGFYSITQGNPVFIIAAVALSMILIFFCNSSYELCLVLILAYFLLDQIAINLGGSTFKVYFILSIVTVFLGAYHLNAILSTRIFRNLIFWIISCLILNFLNGGGIVANRTFLGIVLQSLSAVVIFLFLDMNKINLEQLERIIFLVIKVGLIFGFVQYFVYLLTGVPLSFNANVVANQLAIGQIPSFRYEGNTYGKLVSWGIIFIIPQIVRNTVRRKEYVRWLWISIIMALISITRSSTYSMLIALLIFILVSIIQRRLNKIMGIIFGIIAVLSVIFILVGSEMIQLGSYSVYKMQNFFVSLGNIGSDGSANYRYTSMSKAIDIWRSSIKNILVGVGYAQADGDLTSIGGLRNANLSACDIVSLTVSFGIVGILIYLVNYVEMIFGALSRLNTVKDDIKSVWIERILYLSIYAFVLECLSGCMLCPEFWMTFGIAAYVFKSGNVKLYAGDF